MASAEVFSEVATVLGARIRADEPVLPPYPAVASAAARLSELARRTVADVCAVVNADPSIAATVLRIAASAGVRTSAPSTIDAAVWKLGTDEILRIVLAESLGRIARASGPLASLRRESWSHQLISAALCRELAPRRGVAPDEAFLAGLLHDFGEIVVLAQAETVADLPTLPVHEWRALVDDLHCEHGAVLAERWQLPESLREVIVAHHRPQTSQRVFRPLVQLVATVDQIIGLLAGHRGIDALVAVAGLEHDERFRVAAIAARVAADMASLEGPSDRDGRSAVEPARESYGWPADFDITVRHRGTYHMTAVTSDRLAFRGEVALEPGWLSEVEIATGGTAFAMLVHVQSCQRVKNGYAIAAVPFALGGPEKHAWAAVVAHAAQLIEKALSA